MKLPDDTDTTTPRLPARPVARALGAAFTFAKVRPLAAATALSLLLVVLMAVLADVIASHGPLDQSAQILEPPSAAHYFGTDGQGRDVFSRVVHGARASLLVGFLALGMAAASGVAIGTLSAYRGGALDLLIQRLVDVLLGFPFLVVALIMIVALEPSTTSIALAIALALAPQVARLARAATLATMKEGYVEAAKVSGAGPGRIIWRHLLPNSFPPILAQLTGYLGAAVVAETALSYLRLGTPPPHPSWGRMLQEGVQQYFEAAPWATLFPALALAITVFSAALLGDQMRDMFGPKPPPISKTAAPRRPLPKD